jgi:predicted HicB family RNase H-like nuclease
VAGSIRERLATAASELRAAAKQDLSADRPDAAEKKLDAAAAVEAVLAPRGYLLLKEQRAGSALSPLSLTVDESLKQALVAAAAEFDVVLDGLVEEAYRKVRDGEWIPPERVKSRKGQAGPKKVLQVRVDGALREEVQGMLAELTEQAGYRVLESSIAISYMCEELGVERPGAVATDRLITRIPKQLLEHFNQRASEEGVTLQQVLDAGIRALLDGTWTVERHPYFTEPKRGPHERSWSEADRAKLSVPVNKDLLAGLRDKTQKLSQDLGYAVYPGSVARAILTDRLGEPAE